MIHVFKSESIDGRLNNLVSHTIQPHNAQSGQLRVSAGRLTRVIDFNLKQKNGWMTGFAYKVAVFVTVTERRQ